MLDDFFPKPISHPITVKEAIGADGCYYNSSYRWSIRRNVPFATFTKTRSKSHQILINGKTREVTQDELKIGASYPIQFTFLSHESAIAQIGNSVPPLLIYAIASQIKSILSWHLSSSSFSSMKSNSYLNILNDAWQKHLAPRDSNAPTVISTFAGCGGSSLGYSMAGFRELLAIEWDDNAVATFKLNFPDIPVFHGDIAKLSIESVFQRTGLSEGELDVFDGSPPCQGFSTAGKRKMDDSRNQLFHEYTRLLRGLKPKCFVMENVSGMVKGKMKLIFAEIMRELKASGYKVSARLLNAMYFNVPQSRERMIFIGIREDLETESSHPKAISRAFTTKDALTKPLDHKQKSDKVSSLRAKRWRETKPGKAHHERFSLIRLDWNKTPATILKVSGSGGHMHPSEPRLLDTGELQRCASFPDEFLFAGNWSNSVERIGNSVPPLFMKAIAEHIRAHCLNKLST